MHDERTCKFGSKPVYLLPRKPHLKAEIIQIKLVIHLLGSYGEHLDTVCQGRVRSVLTLRRHVDALEYLLRCYCRRVVCDNGIMMVHESLHPVDSRNLLEPGLERHGAAVAFSPTSGRLFSSPQGCPDSQAWSRCRLPPLPRFPHVSSMVGSSNLFPIHTPIMKNTTVNMAGRYFPKLFPAILANPHGKGGRRA